jgi:hypothetical protein
MLLAAACCGIVDACAGGASDTNAGAVGTITAIADRPALTIQQGSSDTIQVTVARSGGYTGPVTWNPVIADGAAITATVDHIVTTNNVTTARVIVAVGSAFQVGLQPVTLIVQPTGAVPAVRVELAINVSGKTAVAVSAQRSIQEYLGTVDMLSVLVRRTNYSGPVLMSLPNLPVGMVASFRPNPVMGTDCTTDLTLSVDSSAPLGAYNFDVRADGGSVAGQATAPMTITVAPITSVALTLSSSPIARAGGTAVDTVTLTRMGWGGEVNLTVDGLPTGVTVKTAFSFTLGEADAIILTFLVAPSQAAGSYPIVIYGSALGAVPENIGIPATLTITP